MAVPPREPLHQAAFLIDRDEGDRRGLGIAQDTPSARGARSGEPIFSG